MLIWKESVSPSVPLAGATVNVTGAGRRWYPARSTRREFGCCCRDWKLKFSVPSVIPSVNVGTFTVTVCAEFCVKMQGGPIDPLVVAAGCRSPVRRVVIDQVIGNAGIIWIVDADLEGERVAFGALAGATVNVTGGRSKIVPVTCLNDRC